MVSAPAPAFSAGVFVTTPSFLCRRIHIITTAGIFWLLLGLAPVLRAALPELSVQGNRLVDEAGNTVRLNGWHQPTGSWFCGYGRFFQGRDYDGCVRYLKRVADTFTDPSPRYGYNHGWHANQVRINSEEDYHGLFTKGNFSLPDFKTWTERVLIPYVDYCETKGLYVTVFPAVGVPQNSTTPELQALLLDIWDYLSTHPSLKNRKHVHFELCNEPIRARAADGTWGDSEKKYWDALTDWLQPIVNKIRNNGARNVIWAPGLGYQSHYAGFATRPLQGENIGYAVHIYPAYWSDGPVSDISAKVRRLWETQYRPVAKIAPINVTEVWWLRKFPTDDTYWSLFDGVTGTNERGFGATFKQLVEEDNASVCFHANFLILGQGPTATGGDPDGVLGFSEAGRDSASTAFFHWSYLWRDLGPSRQKRDTTPGRIINLSVRARAGANNETLIVGFASQGRPRPVVLRGVGSTLDGFSVPDALRDPEVQLFSFPDGAALGANKDWPGAGGNLTDKFAQVGAFAFDAADQKSAALAFEPDASRPSDSAMTMHVLSETAASGVALAEVYDLTAKEAAPTGKLKNISARSGVDASGKVLIAGFVIQGSQPLRVLIRAVGPGLVPHNVSGTHPNPKLTLYAKGNPVEIADDWSAQSNAAAVLSAFTPAGAFSLPAGSKDAAIVTSLPPGEYTAVVTSSGATEAGVALVEVYSLE